MMGRWGAEVAWNPVGLGGPTAAGSNGETNGDREFFERLRRSGGRCRPPTGTQISGGKGFGSPSATLFITNNGELRREFFEPSRTPAAPEGWSKCNWGSDPASD